MPPRPLGDAPRPVSSPVAIAIVRAPPISRSSSGWLIPTPRSLLVSMLVARVVSSPRETWKLPPLCRVSRKFQ